jgi:hypothetical protein
MLFSTNRNLFKISVIESYLKVLRTSYLTGSVPILLRCTLIFTGAIVLYSKEIKKTIGIQKKEQ